MPFADTTTTTSTTGTVVVVPVTDILFSIKSIKSKRTTVNLFRDNIIKFTMSLDNLLNRVVTIKGYSGNYLKNHGTHVSFTNMERSLATQWVIYSPDPSKDDIFIKCLANGKNLQIVANGDAYVTNTNELLWEAFHIESDASGHVFFVSHHTGNVLRIGDRGGRACAYNANRLEWERMLVEPVTPDPKDLILMQTSFPGLFKQVIKAVSPDAQIYLDMICNILCCTHSGTEMDSLVVSMVSRFPETLEMRCADGNLAFHVALEFKGSEEVVLAIFNANSKASQEKSVKGDHPLHQAIRKKHSEKVVLNIFKSYKKASQKESADGELLLHRAIQNDYSDHIVLKILSAYPCAAMIRCKKSGMLPLHLAAASSASPRLVEALISEYPEALQIAVNNTIPRDLVSAALPMESIKLICRPSLHCNIMPSKQQDKVNIERAKESGNAESLKQVATEVLDMSKIIEGLSKDILKLNTTVEALQRRLDGLDSKYFVPQNISTELLGESLGALRVPFPAEHSVTTAHKPPMLKLDSTEEITVCFVYIRVPHEYDFFTLTYIYSFRSLIHRKKKKFYSIQLNRHR